MVSIENNSGENAPAEQNAQAQNLTADAQSVAGDALNPPVPSGSGSAVEVSIEQIDDETPEECLKRAAEFMTEGKRHLVCKNYAEAVTAFDNACLLFSTHYGDLAIECGEPNFYYGKSLIELERVNMSIIVVGDKKPEDQQEESEEDTEEEPEKMDENEEKLGKIEEIDENQKIEELEEKVISDEKPEEPAVTDENKENVELAESRDQEPVVEEPTDKNDQDDEASNTALAWQVLDLARIIYESYQSENAEYKSRLVDCRILLGEVCVLDEKYDEAVSEFTAALELLTKMTPPDERRLAEIYFQIGSAAEYDGKYNLAAVNMTSAVDTLKTRVKNLHISNDQTEIDEISALITDIEQRRNDVIEFENSSAATKAQLKEFLGKQAENQMVPEVQDNGKVDDVTYLVRKTVKRVSEPEEMGNDVKRTKKCEENGGEKIENVEKPKNEEKIENVVQ